MKVIYWAGERGSRKWRRKLGEGADSKAPGWQVTGSSTRKVRAVSPPRACRLSGVKGWLGGGAFQTSPALLEHAGGRREVCF